MMTLWRTLPAIAQDGIAVILLVIPFIAITLAFAVGHRPFKLSRALMRAHLTTSFGFAALIGIALSVGIGLIAQERSLREGSAKAAEKFDLVIGSPGSEVTLMLSAVYLQPNPLALLDGAVFNEVAGHPRTALAAPLAFGDSYEGATIVGTTAEFAMHLGALASGEMWQKSSEALIGSEVELSIGDQFDPAHGHGDAADDEAHIGATLTIVGQMVQTGSPWDKAILVPIESVWETHGLANGHAPDRRDQLGPPFDAAFFPGTSAIVVIADSFSGTYQIHSDYTNDPRTSAILPGAVLGYIHRLLGDARTVATLLTWLSLGLVALAVLVGLSVLARLFHRHLAVLAAIGASTRFVAATVWGFCAYVIVLGATLGTAGAYTAVGVIGGLVARQTGIDLLPALGWLEFQLLGGFLSVSAMVAAFISLRLAYTSNPLELRG
ncbi:MAG: ABC transporter permease [Pseudomonadota bacterium]